MTAIAMQKKLIKKISEIEDVSLLESINNYLDSHAYILSNKQLHLIQEAENQYAKNNFIDSDEMDRKVAEWKKEK